MNVGKLTECATFLYQDKTESPTGTSRRHPVGTAFFVTVPIGKPESLRSAAYLVTARHIVDGSRNAGPLLVRLNMKTGGFCDYAISPDSWVISPTADVAVALVTGQWIMPPFVGAPILFEDLICDRHPILNSRESVWIGDNVYFVSLFSRYAGEGPNEPVIRFGNVSLIPRRPVELSMPGDTRLMVDAYLVEARSWGGHSGSPAILVREHGPAGLLGIVSGHFTIPEDVVFEGDIADQGSARVPVNAGMAIVTPAQHIADLLLRDDFDANRDALEVRTRQPQD